MDFVDELFKAGCGYLGWSPSIVLNTPIPQLMLALEGKFDFAVKTNPFGGKPAEAKKPVSEDVIIKRRKALEAINAKARAVREKRCQNQ